MGNLSEHFSYNDFVCRCESCKGKGEYKIHLGLVGGLELLISFVKKPIRIITGFRCEESSEKTIGSKKSYHTQGKAANISVEGISLPQLFKAAEQIPEFRGIGFYPNENFIHVDTRAGEREEWIKEHGKYAPMIREKKRQYNIV